MAVNDIKVRFACEECKKEIDTIEHGIFTCRGELLGNLSTDVPKGWISLDIHDNTKEVGEYSSHDFCSYGCLIKHFQGKDIQNLMIRPEGPEDRARR